MRATKLNLLVCLFAGLAALSACSNDTAPPPAPATETAAPAAATETGGNVFDSQFEVKDQAAALEQQVLDSQGKTDEAMDEQSQ